MSMALEIPLTPQAQKFRITLVEVEYQFVVRWNTIDESWLLDIYDTDNNPILLGIALVTSSDLLEQFKYLKFGFMLYVMTDGNVPAVPTYENLGIESHLFAIIP